MYQSKNMTELGILIEQTRLLLGWPTNRKLVKLVDKYPSDQAWEYALARLKEADHPNEKYLIACLETAVRGDISGHRGKKVILTSPIWFCYHCGYALEYCRCTAGWSICPYCLRRDGVERRLTYIDRSVPDWSRGS